MAESTTSQRIHTFCGLCVARCGALAVVENGRFTRLEPDPSHPTGQALCAKGRAAPELVYNPHRLTYPLRRTRPKSDTDPGWKRISWDEALDLTAGATANCRELWSACGGDNRIHPQFCNTRNYCRHTVVGGTMDCI